MKQSFLFAAFLPVLFFMTSCMTTFSPALRSEFTSNNISISEVQFYNSDTIELERQVKTKDVKVKKGTYVKEKDSLLETIVVESGTPGACIGEDGDAIKVSFVEDDDNKYLTFKLKGSKYVLVSEKGKVIYNGAEYTVTSGDDAYLSINYDDSKEEREKEITVKGRKAVKKEEIIEDTSKKESKVLTKNRTQN